MILVRIYQPAGVDLKDALKVRMRQHLVDIISFHMGVYRISLRLILIKDDFPPVEDDFDGASSIVVSIATGKWYRSIDRFDSATQLLEFVCQEVWEIYSQAFAVFTEMDLHVLGRDNSLLYNPPTSQ